MDFLSLKDISERHLEFINPTSRDKLVRAGRAARLRAGQQVIDFGCGFGGALALWAQEFDIGGFGIDVRPFAIERARVRAAERGLADRLRFACASAAGYGITPGSFDVAACIGATFAWPGLLPDALRAMKDAVRPGGSMVIGEVYWRDPALVPPDVLRRERSIGPEPRIYEQIRAAGCDVIYALHSNQDEWDNYYAEDWRGLADWLAENPGHPDYAEVHQHLRDGQDEYAAYGRSTSGGRYTW
jgi:SAM-dependent methyltransferase